MATGNSKLERETKLRGVILAGPFLSSKDCAWRGATKSLCVPYAFLIFRA
jgi:hypothetical protein